MVLGDDVEPGDKVLVEADGDELKFDVQKGGASQEVATWPEEREPERAPEQAGVR